MISVHLAAWFSLASLQLVGGVWVHVTRRRGNAAVEQFLAPATHQPEERSSAAVPVNGTGEFDTLAEDCWDLLRKIERVQLHRNDSSVGRPAEKEVMLESRTVYRLQPSDVQGGRLTGAAWREQVDYVADANVSEVDPGFDMDFDMDEAAVAAAVERAQDQLSSNYQEQLKNIKRLKHRLAEKLRKVQRRADRAAQAKSSPQPDGINKTSARGQEFGMSERMAEHFIEHVGQCTGSSGVVLVNETRLFEGFPTVEYCAGRCISSKSCTGFQYDDSKRCLFQESNSVKRGDGQEYARCFIRRWIDRPWNEAQKAAKRAQTRRMKRGRKGTYRRRSTDERNPPVLEPYYRWEEDATWVAPNTGYMQVLLVGGGGGGGGRVGGGGGGGAVVEEYNVWVISGTTYTITVGAGGAGGSGTTGSPEGSQNGGQSCFGSLCAQGGGGGGGDDQKAGKSGGNGGGGAMGGAGGSGTYSGGGSTSGTWNSGGGGGAGGAGASGTSTICGNGGNGVVSCITGDCMYYGGGGGGGSHDPVCLYHADGAQGGLGGGGTGGLPGGKNPGYAGERFFGGGGGGGSTEFDYGGEGGQGGDGIVIFAYLELSCLPATQNGGTCRVHTTAAACLSHRDGRGNDQSNGLRLGNEPCIWCGGQNCHSWSSSTYCEARDYVLTGGALGSVPFLRRTSYSVASCKSPTIIVESNGGWRGRSYFYVNGWEWSTTNNGFNYVEADGVGGVWKTASFNTYGSSTARYDLEDAIANAAVGNTIMLSIARDGSNWLINGLETGALDAIEGLGATLIQEVGYEEPFVLVAVKGSPGLGVFEASGSRRGQATTTNKVQTLAAAAAITQPGPWGFRRKNSNYMFWASSGQVTNGLVELGGSASLAANDGSYQQYLTHIADDDIGQTFLVRAFADDLYWNTNVGQVEYSRLQFRNRQSVLTADNRFVFVHISDQTYFIKAHDSELYLHAEGNFQRADLVYFGNEVDAYGGTLKSPLTYAESSDNAKFDLIWFGNTWPTLHTNKACVNFDTNVKHAVCTDWVCCQNAASAAGMRYFQYQVSSGKCIYLQSCDSSFSSSGTNVYYEEYSLKIVDKHCAWQYKSGTAGNHWTIESCFEYCNSAASCKFFFHFPSTGWCDLYWACPDADLTEASIKPSNLYVMKLREPEPYEVINHHLCGGLGPAVWEADGSSSQYGDSITDIDECKAICGLNDDCGGFTVDPWGKCSLFSYYPMVLTAGTNYHCYAKNTPGSLITGSREYVCNYDIYYQSSSTFSIISNVFTYQECADRCTAAACYAFSHLTRDDNIRYCELKNGINEYRDELLERQVSSCTAVPDPTPSPTRDTPQPTRSPTKSPTPHPTVAPTPAVYFRGCFQSGGDDGAETGDAILVNSVIGCAEEARILSTKCQCYPAIGLKDPHLYDDDGLARCVLLPDGVPYNLTRLPDTECDAEYQEDGFLIGGQDRMAVYSQFPLIKYIPGSDYEDVWYTSRTAARTGCLNEGFGFGLCYKEDLLNFPYCKAGWTEDFVGYWVDGTDALCENREGYISASTASGAFCCQVEYQYVEQTNICPPGYDTTSTAAECQNIASHFCPSQGYRGTASVSTDPEGCYIRNNPTSTSTCQVWFNTHASATATSTAVRSKICKALAGALSRGPYVFQTTDTTLFLAATSYAAGTQLTLEPPTREAQWEMFWIGGFSQLLKPLDSDITWYEDSGKLTLRNSVSFARGNPGNYLRVENLGNGTAILGFSGGDRFYRWRSSMQCADPSHEYVGYPLYAEDCFEACLTHAKPEVCNYVLLGKSTNQGKCWWEYDAACKSIKFANSNSFDIYKRYVPGEKPWFYLKKGEGVPLQCAGPNMIMCASDGLGECLWGNWGSRYSAWEVVEVAASSQPIQLDCEVARSEWMADDGADPCEILGCYELYEVTTLTAIAEQTAADSGPGFVVDGDMTTRWVAGVAPPAWVQVSLNQEITVRRVDMWTYQTGSYSTEWEVKWNTAYHAASWTGYTTDHYHLHATFVPMLDKINNLRFTLLSGHNEVGVREVKVYGQTNFTVGNVRPWYYLASGSGSPVRCSLTPDILECASFDGNSCPWGWYGSGWSKYQPMMGVFSSHPYSAECPGWSADDGSDHCGTLGCYSGTKYVNTAGNFQGNPVGVSKTRSQVLELPTSGQFKMEMYNPVQHHKTVATCAKVGKQFGTIATPSQCAEMVIADTACGQYFAYSSTKDCRCCTHSGVFVRDEDSEIYEARYFRPVSMKETGKRCASVRTDFGEVATSEECAALALATEGCGNVIDFGASAIFPKLCRCCAAHDAGVSDGTKDQYYAHGWEVCQDNWWPFEPGLTRTLSNAVNGQEIFSYKELELMISEWKLNEWWEMQMYVRNTRTKTTSMWFQAKNIEGGGDGLEFLEISAPVSTTWKLYSVSDAIADIVNPPAFIVASDGGGQLEVRDICVHRTFVPTPAPTTSGPTKYPTPFPTRGSVCANDYDVCNFDLSDGAQSVEPGSIFDTDACADICDYMGGTCVAYEYHEEDRVCSLKQSYVSPGGTRDKSWSCCLKRDTTPVSQHTLVMNSRSCSTEFQIDQTTLNSDEVQACADYCVTDLACKYFTWFPSVKACRRFTECAGANRFETATQPSATYSMDVRYTGRLVQVDYCQSSTGTCTQAFDNDFSDESYWKPWADSPVDTYIKAFFTSSVVLTVLLHGDPDRADELPLLQRRAQRLQHQLHSGRGEGVVREHALHRQHRPELDRHRAAAQHGLCPLGEDPPDGLVWLALDASKRPRLRGQDHQHSGRESLHLGALVRGPVHAELRHRLRRARLSAPSGRGFGVLQGVLLGGHQQWALLVRHAILQRLHGADVLLCLLRHFPGAGPEGVTYLQLPDINQSNREILLIFSDNTTHHLALSQTTYPQHVLLDPVQTTSVRINIESWWNSQDRYHEKGGATWIGFYEEEPGCTESDYCAWFNQAGIALEDQAQLHVEGNVWYFGDVITGVGAGSSNTNCNSNVVVCGGGTKYGGQAQADAVKAAVENGGKHPNAPTTPAPTVAPTRIPTPYPTPPPTPPPSPHELPKGTFTGSKALMVPLVALLPLAVCYAAGGQGVAQLGNINLPWAT